MMIKLSVMKRNIYKYCCRFVLEDKEMSGFYVESASLTVIYYFYDGPKTI